MQKPGLSDRQIAHAQQVFTSIYKNAVWARNENGEGSSGPGSTLKLAKPFIDFVQDFINDHDIGSIVDFGCGEAH